jgi:hypothetical protein
MKIPQNFADSLFLFWIRLAIYRARGAEEGHAHYKYRGEFHKLTTLWHPLAGISMAPAWRVAGANIPA